MSAGFSSLIVVMVVIIGLIAVVAIAVVMKYNGLVRARNMFRTAFAQIDVQLKRRHDLVPNLVETAKAFMTHERSTLEAVIQARNAAESARTSAAANPGDPAAMGALASAESGLGGVLGRLFALSEAYPELRSNQNMLQLQEELTSTENKVSFARQFYNDAVMGYNNRIESFPDNMIAGMFKFTRAEFFEVPDEGERSVPAVKF